jgi:predicted Zn-dependent protease with MMP-like domain
MADSPNPEIFAEIVERAYGTLPHKIRDLPDFPGIQVVDEPPADVLGDPSNRKKWRRGAELLGLYISVPRTKQRHNLLRIAPDLIFVFRGPILRCFQADLRAEVTEDLVQRPPESEAPKTVLRPRRRDTFGEAGEAKQPQPRCLKRHSAVLRLPRTRQAIDLFWSVAERSRSCPRENLCVPLVWVRMG